MSDVIVRDLRPDEAEAAARIAVAAWAPIYAQFREILGDELFAARCPNWQEDKASQVRRACAPDSAAGVCVAEKAGQVVGFITYYPNAHTGIGEIGNNAVHPDFQGQGIASLMYQCVLDRFRAQGMRFAKVHTGLDPSHAPARRAYEKAGFSIALPSVDYYRKL